MSKAGLGRGEHNHINVQIGCFMTREEHRPALMKERSQFEFNMCEH